MSDEQNHVELGTLPDGIEFTRGRGIGDYWVKSNENAPYGFCCCVGTDDLQGRCYCY